MNRHYRHWGDQVTVFLCLILMLLTLGSCDGNMAEPDLRESGVLDTGRAYRTQPRGGGEDVVTVMLYLCGSDLESRGGAATGDLDEIMAADIGDNINIIVETGGADAWDNDFVDAGTNQRWKITNDGPQLLADMGPRDMSLGDTLTDFITYSAQQFPADRYLLVLWDHGGGTVNGYAYDERFGKDTMMSISELGAAMENAGVVFDMIGFDCCLMSTAETAFMVEKYADFMVASQRVEPGDGWYYTAWINALSENSSIGTLELGKIIVDSFIMECSDGYYGNELTLAVTDLSYIPDLFETLYTFFAEAQQNLISDEIFISTAQTLGQSRAINDNYDLVDISYLAAAMDGAEPLLAKLEQCVAYNGATIENHNGLCLYFPYTDLSKVGSALEIYSQIGIEERYQNFISAFASLMAGGQAYRDGEANPLGGDAFDPSYWLEQEWVDENLIESSEAFYAENQYDDEALCIEEKGDGYVLALSDEDWNLITAIEQWVFVDDGAGYIGLGADSMYAFDDDGDLLIDFDNTWVTLEGQLVCFYTLEEVVNGDDWYTYGSVPVWIEGEEAELIVLWDSDAPEGYVAGWRMVADDMTSQKGLYDLYDGLHIEFLCDYYSYNGEYDDRYLLGELTVNGPIAVCYEDVGEADCEVYYVLYDIYRNT